MMVTRWQFLAVVGTLVTSMVLPALSAESVSPGTVAKRD